MAEQLDRARQVLRAALPNAEPAIGQPRKDILEIEDDSEPPSPLDRELHPVRILADSKTVSRMELPSSLSRLAWSFRSKACHRARYDQPTPARKLLRHP